MQFFEKANNFSSAISNQPWTIVLVANESVQFYSKSLDHGRFRRSMVKQYLLRTFHYSSTLKVSRLIGDITIIWNFFTFDRGPSPKVQPRTQCHRVPAVNVISPLELVKLLQQNASQLHHCSPQKFWRAPTTIFRKFEFLSFQNILVRFDTVNPNFVDCWTD